MRLRHASTIVGWLVLACALASPALGQATPGAAGAPTLDRAIGQRITEIRLLIDGRAVDDPELRKTLETVAGAPLRAVDVRESIIHLMALARFEDVSVDAELGPAGVALTYQLATQHPVESIEFRGDLGLPARQLRAAVEERYSKSPPRVRAEEISVMLEGLLRDHGFLKATVKPAEAPSTAREKLVFEVNAGTPARVGRATVEGQPEVSAEQLLDRLDVKTGSRFDRLALDGAVTRYLRELRARGFLEAKIAPDYLYASGGESVDVVIRMTRGPRVMIAFRGDPMPAKRADEIVGLLKEGALDDDALENEEQSIVSELRARGYRDASAPFQREAKGPDLEVVVFTVTRGPQYRVAGIEISGNQQLPRAEIQAALKLQPGQWFVKAKLDADAASIQRLYQNEGFQGAKVEAATSQAGGDPTQLQLRYSISEGPRTTIAAVEFEHVTVFPVGDLQKILGSRVGGPYNAQRVEDDRETVLDQYQAQGYQQATVTVPPGLSPDGTRFTLRFAVDEGPKTLIDHILIVGNARTKASTIERELGLKPGMALSFVSMAEAQRRLSELGLFRRVQVTELERSTENRRDVVVTIEEAPVNTIGYGGGFEASMRTRLNTATNQPEDTFDAAPRGFFEIGRRNLWGKNRSINLFARGAIRSSDQFSGDSTTTATTTTTIPPLTDASSGFREYRVLGAYREPRFMDAPIDLTVSAEVDQAIRTTFDFNRRQVVVDASHRLSPTLSVDGRYTFGHTRLFNERIDPNDQLNVDKVFPRVQLSMFSGSVIRSTRDDAFEPTRGTLASFDVTFAPRAIGSAVGFVKGSWQAFGYKQIPALRNSVLAAGVRLGLAFGFPQTALNEEGTPVAIEQELPASERFFAGGDTTVRGYALDRLGSASVLDPNGISNGGNGLFIGNLELRVPVKWIGVAAFIDTGNVFAKVSGMHFSELRSGAGFGIRWRSPVGPLRVDLAWKLNPMTFNGVRESRFAWYVTIGQAF